MSLPRPASPKALWADLRAFWRERPRHQWVAGILALLIPLGIVVVFYLDANTNIMPGEQVIYAESWPATRSDEEIKTKQEADLARRQAAEERRRQEFQRLEDGMNRLGI